MSDDGLFSRDEILSGGASSGDVRRARALVFLIEQESERANDLQRAVTASAMSANNSAFVSLESILDPEALRGPLPGEADEAFVESFRAVRRPATMVEWTQPSVPAGSLIRRQVSNSAMISTGKLRRT